MKQTKVSVVVLLMVIAILVMEGLVKAKSIYAITDHHATIMKAYEIQGDKIEYQQDVIVSDYSNGAVDVTIDSNLVKLFISYEGPPIIVWASPQTLKQEGYVNLSEYGVPTLAGIVADEEKNRVYTVSRNGDKLYICSWNDEEKKLELMDPDDPNQPYTGQGDAHITLTGLSVNGAYGLALDGNRLYVSNATSTVHHYDTDSWGLSGSRDVGRDVADIAVDPANGTHPAYLYAGALYIGGSGHNFLVKHNLEAAVNPNIENDIGTTPIGLAVDPDSGLVYVTTSNRKVCVYDCSNNPFIRTDSDATGGSSGPAGICVPGKGSDISFVPPLGVIKTDDVEDCVDPVDGEEITYTITVWNQWQDPCDPCDAGWNELEILTIIDYLAEEVDFISMDPCENAVYDPCSHTVTWTFDPNCPVVALPFSVSIVVSVNEYVVPGGSIKNTVRIEMVIDGKEYWDEETIYTDVCGCGEYGDIIYVDKDATAGNQDGSSWYDAFLNLDAGLEIATVCDKIYVAEGRYRPTADPCDQDAAYNMVNGVAVYGGFAGLGADDPDERNWMIYETILCGDIANNDNYNFPVTDDPNRHNAENSYYVVRSGDKVNCAILDGFIVRNGWEGGISCESGALTATHNRIKENIQGIYGYDARMFIENNWIYRNIDGIYMEDPNAVITVGHCTVANNHEIGIYFDGWIDPVITNSIIWGHSDEDNDLIGCDATYSCIEYPIEQTDPSDPNIIIGIGLGNIDDDPCFVDSENDDYHLSWDSPCIDTGDPGMYYGGKRDIDKHWRKLGLRTDMGADEYKDCSYISPADFNEDEIVNLLDFCDFAAHWLYTSNDQGWDSLYDLDGDGTIIDIADLALFAEDWLWMSCERMVSLPMKLGKTMAMGMRDGQKSAERSASTDRKIASPPPEPIIEIEVTEKLLDDGTKIELLAYPTGDLIAKIVTDPRGNITHFIIYLDDGDRVELICTYDNMGNETSAIYTHYDADGNIILVERMEDDMLL